MQDYQDRLNGAEDRARLSEPVSYRENLQRAKRGRKRVYKRWSALYFTTVVIAATAIILLVAFGMRSDNTPLRDNVLTELADKIVSFFVGMDFPFSDNNTTPPAEQPDEPVIDSGNSNGGTNNTPEADKTDKPVSGVVNDIYDFDYSKVPEGHTPIIPMDLSLSQYGHTYINNATGYTPDTAVLINKVLGGSVTPLTADNGPVVLIIHTHGTEAYSEDGAISIPSDTDGFARTSDTSKNVVAVGKALAEELIKNGIPTAHCTVLHDSVQYKDSYARAAETIKKYLEEYPTIKLVIDVHRDSVVKSSGEIVRPVAEIDGKAAAQVMCVVGSSWAGDLCPSWENNLSLALKLRKELNSEYGNICRPPYLKGHTYNQEIAPYSLLLEFGAEGNSLDEALVTAKLTAQKLALLVGQI